MSLQAHPTHEIEWYEVQDELEESHGYLIACMRCGSYAASRIGRLAQPCLADDAVIGRGLQQQLNRLNKGQHPNCRASEALSLRQFEDHDLEPEALDENSALEFEPEALRHVLAEVTEKELLAEARDRKLLDEMLPDARDK
eukprot:4956652-Amphidinium_carterae.1